MNASLRLFVYFSFIQVCIFIPFNTQSQTISIQGHVCSQQFEPVSFATVQMSSMTDSTQMFFQVTDDQGNFIFTLPKGDYHMHISFLGYEAIDQILHLQKSVQLRDLVLTPSSIQLEEVVVRGNFISRQADRFVMNIGNIPLAMGRDGKDILSLAPGVMLSDEGNVTVYGRSGTQIMVNDRLLRESGTELVTYLQSLQASDIQKIEVIPFAGAEYDANAKGGIIKITLKKLREEGMEGFVNMSYNHSLVNNKAWQMRPSINLKYRHNKFSLYSNIAVNRDISGNEMQETTLFLPSLSRQQSEGEKDNNRTYQALQLGTLYDINDRQSIGLEVNISRNPSSGQTSSSTNINEEGKKTIVSSLFAPRQKMNQISIVGNYTLKLDTAGSAFKVLVDYNRRHVDNYTHYISMYSGFQNYDTTYRNISPTFNNIYTLSTDFEIAIGKRSQIQTGLKYSCNNMNNDMLYEALVGDTWNVLDPRSYSNHYSENIGAIYFSYMAELWKNITIDIGVRGEYTSAIPTNSKVTEINRQKYFNLFPHANLSIPLNEKSSQFLVINYNRTIERPSFNELNPYRIPMSEYSFVEGNPNLTPMYEDDYSLSWIIDQASTITLGYVKDKNVINQVVKTDANDNNIIVYRQENIPTAEMFYANVSIPTQITKWWQINLGLNWSRVSMKFPDEHLLNQAFNGDLSNTFTLWKKWYLDISGYYMSSALFGNLRFEDMWQINAAIKHSFFQQHLTVSINLNDIFNSRDRTITAESTNFRQVNHTKYGYRTMGISLRYNFKAGPNKNLKVKYIESGSEDEKSRL